MANDGVTANDHGRIASASSPKRDITLVGRIMARAANGTGDWLVRSIAIGASSVIVAGVGYTLHTLNTNSNKNTAEISSIKSEVSAIKADVSDIKEEMRRD